MLWQLIRLYDMMGHKEPGVAHPLDTAVVGVAWPSSGNDPTLENWTRSTSNPIHFAGTGTGGSCGTVVVVVLVVVVVVVLVVKIAAVAVEVADVVTVNACSAAKYVIIL